MPTNLKGYLFVQPHTEFLEAPNVPYKILDEEVEMPKESYAIQNWYPITQAFRRDGLAHISAEQPLKGFRYEVHFVLENNLPGRENGSYEITGGPFSGRGTVKNAERRENLDFKHFFVCHSLASTGKGYLRWQIGLSGDLFDADNVDDN